MKITKLITILFLALITINCTDTKKETSPIVDEESLEVAKEQEPIMEDNLFNRLGGEEGISAIVEDIVAAHLVNPTIKDRFTHLNENPEHNELFKQNVKDFFGAGTGGGITYNGKDMLTAHKGLNLSGMEFIEGISDIMMVLEKHDIDEESRKDVLYILYSFKDQVIGQ